MFGNQPRMQKFGLPGVRKDLGKLGDYLLNHFLLGPRSDVSARADNHLIVVPLLRRRGFDALLSHFTLRFPAMQQIARLHVPITGTSPAVEALLARPKLGLPRDALYDPKRLGGDAAIQLTLSFPLLNALSVADIDIKADAAVICDTEMFAPELPTICTGLRGMVYGELVVQGAGHDLHSGVYGGAVPNPIFAIAEILTALKDRA